MRRFSFASNKPVMVLSAGVLLIAGLFLHPHSRENSLNLEISKRLDEMSSQLIQLQKTINQPQVTTNLNPIQQNLNQLTQLISEVKFKNGEELKQLFNEHRQEISHKLNVIHAGIDSLEHQQHPIKWLPATALPFKVVSIDTIQQHPIVSVAYHYQTVPLEVHDALAGWTVVATHYAQQKVEFKNKEDVHVLISLTDNEATHA